MIRTRPCLCDAEPTAVLVLELKDVSFPAPKRNARFREPLSKTHACAAAIWTLEPAHADCDLREG